MLKKKTRKRLKNGNKKVMPVHRVNRLQMVAKTGHI